jgi:hypothetical protein
VASVLEGKGWAGLRRGIRGALVWGFVIFCWWYYVRNVFDFVGFWFLFRAGFGGFVLLFFCSVLSLLVFFFLAGGCLVVLWLAEAD